MEYKLSRHEMEQSRQIDALARDKGHELEPFRPSVGLSRWIGTECKLCGAFFWSGHDQLHEDTVRLLENNECRQEKSPFTLFWDGWEASYKSEGQDGRSDEHSTEHTRTAKSPKSRRRVGKPSIKKDE
jgi:hypothetical protein